MIGRFGNFIRRFHQEEDGGPTLEFLMVLPAFWLFFLISYESAILSTRHSMLERGLDVAIREVRVGILANPTHDTLARRICDEARIIPSCMSSLRLEMLSTPLRNFNPPSARTDCSDRGEPGSPVLNFNTGLNNEMMIVRACALFTPRLPWLGLGYGIPKERNGQYALKATTAYVMEPFQS